MDANHSDRLEHYLKAFESLPTLKSRVSQVLYALPNDVQQDFLDDSTFRVTLEDFEPGRGWTMFMDLPPTGNAVSRCVVLRSKLERTGRLCTIRDRSRIRPRIPQERRMERNQ